MRAQTTATLRRQLAAGLLAVLSLLAGASIFGLRQLVRANERRDVLVEGYVSELLFAERLRGAADRASAATRGFLLTGAADALKSANASALELDELLGEVGATRDPNPLIPPVTSAGRAYVSEVRRVVAERRGMADASSIVDTFEERVLPMRRSLDAAIELLVDARRSEAERARAEARSAATNAIAATASLLGAAIALSGLIAVVVVRRFGRMHAREQQALQAAQRAVQAREDVLAMVAHDLRNPLGVITLRADQLQRAATHDECRSHAERIETTARRVASLIDSLVDAASIEAGRLSVMREPVSVEGLVDVALEEVADASGQKQVRIEAVVLDGGAPLYADGDRIIQVLINLLTNAIKHTPTEGAICVRAERRGDRVHFSVADSGAGIPPSETAHVFDRFWTAARGKGPGTGLGLFICRGIVEAHGGTIHVASAVGKGTTFFFDIPDGDDAPARRTVAPEGATAVLTLTGR